MPILRSCYTSNTVSFLSFRSWGEFRNPSIIPLVDFAYDKTDLCNPDGDGDVACKGRQRQFNLQPAQQDDGMLAFATTFSAKKGAKLYATSHSRAPWETLQVFGYADHSHQFTPDLLFLSRFNKFAQEHKLHFDELAQDHPLKHCANRQSMGWSHTGSASAELRTWYVPSRMHIQCPTHMPDTYYAHAQLGRFLLLPGAP